ncbi:MAG: hypothetical protein WCO06_06665 [Candidatus Roizmanbacteria bacterium]
MALKKIDTSPNYSLIVKVGVLGVLLTSALGFATFLGKSEYFQKLSQKQKQSNIVAQSQPSQIKSTGSVLSAKDSQDIIEEVQSSSQKLIDTSVQKADEVKQNVLESASQKAQDVASKSASFVTNLVLDNTIGKLLEQVKNLPKDQQDKLKQYVCK